MRYLKKLSCLGVFLLLVLISVETVKAEQNKGFENNAIFVPGQVIVGMKPNTSVSRSGLVGDLFQGVGVANIETLMDGNENTRSAKDATGKTLLLDLVGNDEQSVLNAIELLEEHPDVAFAEPDYLNYEDDLTESSWKNTLSRQNIPLLWNLQSVRMEEAWNVTRGDSDIKVGVIDSGIDHTHPNLASNVDISLGYNFVLNRPDGSDLRDHGTFVAGVIGAIGQNTYSMMGVAPEVTLVSLKVRNDETATYSTSAIINAIGYANDHGIQIINYSIGSESHSRSLEAAIRAYNGLFVVSAGNNSQDTDIQPQFPGALDIPNMITVGSSNASDQKSSHSNFGRTTVDLFAPGSTMVSTSIGGNFRSASGTSYAAPHVAGAAALALSVNPALATEELKTAILDSTDPVPALANLSVTGGRLNVDKLVTSVASEAPEVPIEPEVVEHQIQRITWVTRQDDDKDLTDKSLVEVLSDFTDRHGRSVINLILRGESGVLDLTDYEIVFSNENVLGNTTTTPEWQERGHLHLPILATGETAASIQHKETGRVEEVLTFVVTSEDEEIEVPEVPETPTAPAFDRLQVYTGGEIVYYEGNLYRARWWTQGGNPANSQAWELIPHVYEDGSVDFRPETAYVGGNLVRFEGRLYRARWWTQGGVPTGAQAWELVGPVQG